MNYLKSKKIEILLMWPNSENLVSTFKIVDYKPLFSNSYLTFKNITNLKKKNHI